VEILAAEFCAPLAAMAIENCIIGDLNFIVQIEQLLNILIIVFHVVALANVRDYPCVVSLN
jgi:hypothetical protein